MTHRTNHTHGSDHSRHAHPAHRGHHAAAERRGPHFSKTFRWQPQSGNPKPHAVAVAGTFTDWKPVAMSQDHATNVWHLTLQNIPGNCTHHYMVLADSQPVSDRQCDGLAAPANDTEKHFALQTARGPRVFMLFSNTK